VILAFVVLFPALLGLLAAGCKTHRSAVSLLVAGASVHLLAAGLFWLDVPRRGLGSFLELDGLGLLFLSIVSVLFFAASL
jgi:formate hydrogenlyase subunit 3/multisubunit Na+/H+ antiporter MnhD subunit